MTRNPAANLSRLAPAVQSAVQPPWISVALVELKLAVLQRVRDDKFISGAAIGMTI